MSFRLPFNKRLKAAGATGSSRRPTGTWAGRSALAVIGLGAAVVDGALYLGFAAYAILIGGFEATFRPVLFWYRIGVWLGVLAIVASGLGQGRMRKWGLIVGIVVFVLWLFRGHR